MNKKIFKVCIVIIITLIIGLGAKFIYGENEEQENKAFKQHVVFYPQHQDDETLWGASAITKAVKECGADNVYVVLISDGSGVNVFNQLPQFKGISRNEKKILRNNEFKAALNSLGVKSSNIRILADETKHQGNHFDLMEKTILDFEKEFDSVTHVAQHHKYDNHPMHRENGKVLKMLSDEGKVKDARYFVKPAYVKDIPQDQIEIYTSNTEEDKSKVKGALDAYKIKNEKKQLYGIGYISTRKYFNHLYNDPQYTSVLSIY
ncbi:PIG-L family deacetylase [Paraclostridium ghonii]|uniref:PIG-L family deacetylase n=1 Tax=Paraclostridium ghonii TaxID=29358 RepID=UPI00202CC2A5|nr:PIG-L family deacetylase [Paeniclostridium ghonii]MCM0167121.1 PIG-L family deacetylase [Paeniclostridium ghonii]